jgi:hypothetical protein
MNTDGLETKGGAAPINTDGAPQTEDKPVVDTNEIKQEMAEVKSRLEEVGAALKGTPSAQEIVGLKSQIDAITATVDGIPGNYKGLIDALTKRVDELQTGAAILGANANAVDQPQGIKAITQQVMDSPIYKSIFDAQGNRGNQVCQAGTFTGRTPIESFAAAGYKAPAPVVISDMAGGNLTAYKPGTVEAREFDMSLATRIPTVVVSNATTYAVPKETLPSRYGAWKSKLAATLNGDPTPVSTATFDDVDGLMVGSVVRFYSATDTVLGSSTVVSINTSTKVVTFTTNSLTWDGTIGWKVTSENYGVSAELATKPSGFVGTANVEFTLKMLASIIPTTVNALNTIQGMQALIERKLPLRDLRNMSQHLLYGDDSAGQLQGLRTYTGAQTSLWSSGVSGDNQVDAVMRAANLIPWGAQTSVIMAQADLPSLYLLKGSDGHYLRTGNFGMVPLTQAGASWFLGPYELVFDQAVVSGDFTVINLALASEIADQNTASLMWGYINDDFSQNIIRARYEATRAHAILDTNEYVVGEWDAAP